MCFFFSYFLSLFLGVLLDSAWSLTDKSRFRLLSGETAEWRLDDVIFIHDGQTEQVRFGPFPFQ